MAAPTSRVEQAQAAFAESERLAGAGFRDRAVEALQASAELLVDELAAREDVRIAHEDIGWHEGRARAAQKLRGLGAVPGGFDNLLRRLNDDRNRTKYDNKPTRFDALTFAQAQASVRIVLDAMGAPVAEPAAEEPAPAPPPVPAPRRPSRLALALAAAGALVVAAVVAIVAFVAGEDSKPVVPARPRQAVVPYTRAARLGGVVYQIDTARTGASADFQPPIRTRRGTLLLVYLKTANPTDRTLPLRLSQLRLRTRGGREYPPGAGLARFTVALTHGARQILPLPFDVPVADLRGARLLVRRTAFDLGLADGIAELMPGTWRGRTADGLPFSMRIDKGDVVRTVTVRGRTCSLNVRGAAFVERGAFRMRSREGATVDGRFTSSITARGRLAGSPSCRLAPTAWRAATKLR